MPSPLDTDDRLALSDLAARYAVAVDTREFSLLRDVFAEPCVLDTGRGTREGLDQILEAMEGLRRYEATTHVLGQQLVEVDDDGVRGITYCTAHHLRVDGDDRRDLVMHIRYHDRFVRPDGAWRIATRRLEIVWTDENPVR